MNRPPEETDDWETRRAQVIGLGEHSSRKSYYPELQQRLRELEQTKTTLAAANRQLQAVLDAASEFSIIATDREGIITTFNKGAEKMLGYSAEELVGRQTPLLLHADDEIAGRSGTVSSRLHRQSEGFHAMVENAILNGSETNQCTYMRKDGKQLLVSLTITVIRGEDEEISGFLGIATDITEQKLLENKLLQSQKMESIGQLAGGLAHDFNNVLSVIIGFASLLQIKLQLQEPEAKMLDNILTASKKAASLTHSLLAFSRKQMIVKKPHNLNSIITNVGKLLTNLIGEDVHLKIRINSEPLPVLVDSGQIEQVILNLATNARDAMPQGGLLAITTELQELNMSFTQLHGFCEPGRYAIITVSDSGKGMDEETRQCIFEPFFTTKETGKGTGLGLAMVYGIIKQHGGSINVYSEPGSGTTFQIYLPIIDSSCDPAPDRSADDTPPTGGSETILVAEDEAPVRELMEKVLTHYGYRVILAENGQDAIDRFRQHQDTIKLVILDMIMPQKSGKTAYDEITQLQPDARALFCSGYAPDIIQRQGELRGNFAFLMKPVKPNELLRKIRELLDKSP